MTCPIETKGTGQQKKIRLVTWHNVSKIMYSLKKSQFNTVKDRIETLISCSKDKFGTEKKKLNLI